MTEWQVPTAKREVPINVVEDLVKRKAALDTFEARRFIPDVEPTRNGWVKDAATSFSIGFIVGDKWAHFKLLPGWDDEPERGGKHNIAWAKNVTIRLGVLVLMALYAVRGKLFVILTNNITLQEEIDQGKLSNQAVNKGWKILQRLLLEQQCKVVAERVKSADNKTDPLSRGADAKFLPVDCIMIEIPTNLFHRIKKVLIMPGLPVRIPAL